MTTPGGATALVVAGSKVRAWMTWVKERRGQGHNGRRCAASAPYDWLNLPVKGACHTELQGHVIRS